MKRVGNITRICSKCGKIKLLGYDFDIEWDKQGDRYRYRGECSECRCKYRKEYYQNNFGYYKEKRKLRYQNYKEHDKQIKKLWYQKNPDKQKIYEKQKYQKESWKKRIHNNNYRVLKMGAKGSHTIEDLKYIYQHQNGLCACCRKSFPFEKMTMDHIVPLSWGGSNYSSNIQLLCKSCNSSKGNYNDNDFRDYVPLFLEGGKQIA